MSQDKKKISKKWIWMMEYCKRQHIPPAQDWAWKEAEKSYNKCVINARKIIDKGRMTER